MIRAITALTILALLINFYSCKRSSTSLETNKNFWEKTSAPDSVSFMKILVTSKGTLLASTGDYPYKAKKDGYIFRSTDFGMNWEEIPLGVDAASSLIEHKSFLFSGTTQGIYRSSDDGVTWELMGLDSVWVNSIASFVDENVNIIITGTPDGIFKSEDIGFSWAKISEKNYDDCIGILNNDVIFAGKIGAIGASLYISQDGGASWTESLSGLGATTISIWDGKIYAGGWRSEEWFGGLHVSVDEGKTWSTIFSDLESVTSTYVYKNIIYLSGYNTGVMMKKNSDSSWTDLNEGLSSLWITSLACDINKNMYAASDLGGIYKSIASIE